MKPRWPVEILGTGSGMPAKVLSNDDIAKMVDTSDEWITRRTGIRERRIVTDGQTTLSLALDASRGALRDAGLSASELDLIICATLTPDHHLPATACQIQHQLGAGTIPAFDLNAACSGFVFGVITAAQFITGGSAGKVLVIGAECLSTITDPQDRSTCILFGDGAAAAVLGRSTCDERGMISCIWGSDGSGDKLIWLPAGGAREPASTRTVNERLHYLRMRGRELYKFAVVRMQELIAETVADAGVSVSDIALIVPHQSNLRIIESACRKLGIPDESVMVNIDRYGNTSAASVPLALHEARRDGRIKSGDLVLLIAFGGGLTWASALMRV